MNYGALRGYRIDEFAVSMNCGEGAASECALLACPNLPLELDMQVVKS